MESKETRDLIFKLAGKRLEQEPEAPNLGVSLSENGITDTKASAENQKRKERRPPTKTSRGIRPRSEPNESDPKYTRH